ncbi:MAG TPA: FAD-dependent oxidoreductase [Chitinophagaceae bacterium]|nr:FAD-dependent oxidoreductase [Chitinophagaceae bacterium]
MIFDTIVIGKGLIGAAAAKYLSSPKNKVALIGPDEPRNPDKAMVFASHYDQGRIQRIIGTDEVWTKLNLTSARQYQSIEKQSGITFHNQDGCLYVNPRGVDEYLSNAAQQAQQAGISYTPFKTAKEITSFFPGFIFPASSEGLFETAPSGSINPRLLIKAQLKLLQQNKGVVINDMAIKIEYEKNMFTVTTGENKTYFSGKILLCPGAFINFFPLTEKKLDLDLKSETVLLAEVTEDEAKRLSNLPSLLYEIETANYRNIYLIKPLQYPDGKFYLKMGCNLPGDIHFDTLAEVQDWFRKGNSDAHLPVLKEALISIMPSLQAKNFITGRCMVSYTRHRKEYIGEIENDGLFVACGGNGYSAMCADAIGKIAARVVLQGSFPPEFSEASFAPVFTK